jgi:hypothetical protein
MTNKNERMNRLNNAGVDTSKYFNISLPNGLKPGATIALTINENGQPVIVRNDIVNDPIAEDIIADGYVRNTKLHRRFVMAQMFHALNYKSYDGRREGYNEYVKRFGIKYEFDMMLEEIRVLSKLEVRDADTFAERSHFFTKDVVMSTMKDYVSELKKYVDTIPDKKCKGVPYKRIKSRDIFVADLQKKVYSPLEREINRLQYASNYNEMYKIVRSFMYDMIALPYGTSKSKAWVDAYKGEGAFYTLKNLVMFHGCGIMVDKKMVYGAAAVSVLNKRLNEYSGEGWRMFALMKKVIADNNFDFASRMREIYND